MYSVQTRVLLSRVEISPQLFALRFAGADASACFVFTVPPVASVLWAAPRPEQSETAVKTQVYLPAGSHLVSAFFTKTWVVRGRAPCLFLLYIIDWLVIWVLCSGNI